MADKVILTRTEYPDSIEIGTPGKGGNIKVYFDANDLAGAQKRIANAVHARQHFLEELAKGGMAT